MKLLFYLLLIFIFTINLILNIFVIRFDFKPFVQKKKKEHFPIEKKNSVGLK